MHQFRSFSENPAFPQPILIRFGRSFRRWKALQNPVLLSPYTSYLAHWIPFYCSIFSALTSSFFISPVPGPIFFIVGSLESPCSPLSFDYLIASLATQITFHFIFFWFLPLSLCFLVICHPASTTIATLHPFIIVPNLSTTSSALCVYFIKPKISMSSSCTPSVPQDPGVIGLGGSCCQWVSPEMLCL